MKNYLYLILALTVLFTACTKDEEEEITPQGTENGTRIKSVVMDGEEILSFIYDNAGRLIREVIHYNNSEMQIEYEYSGGKLTSETATSGGSIIGQYFYTYDDQGKLSRCDMPVPDGEVHWEYTYEEGKIVQSIMYMNGQEGIKKIYNYEGDNMTEAIEYNRFGSDSVWEMQHRVEMEYDNKNNPMFLHHLPFSEVMDEFADFISPNNQTHVTEYDQWNAIEYEIEYSYTYNSEGYPIGVDQTENGNTVHLTILYYE